MMEPFQFPRKPRSGVRRRRRMFEDQADETIEQAKNSESTGPGELSKTVDTESQYQGPKEDSSKLQYSSSDMTSKMSNSVDEDKLDDEKISQLSQELRETEKKLGEVMLRKRNRENALSALQSQRDAVAENLRSVQVEFETIVASYLQ